jgi:UDP-GlcNAc:undecaprenyl-phosphate/decaprenyl-phosphate GlcNAc-1-phosphate transferase
MAFVAATATGAVLTPVIRDLAHRCGLMDYALATCKVHSKLIPRLGGVAIVAAFYVPLLALLFVDSDVGARFYSNPLQAFGLIAGGSESRWSGSWTLSAGFERATSFSCQLIVAGSSCVRLPHRGDRESFGPAIPLGEVLPLSAQRFVRLHAEVVDLQGARPPDSERGMPT